MSLTKRILLVMISLFLVSCSSNQGDSQTIDAESQELASQIEDTPSASLTEAESEELTTSDSVVIDISPIASVEEIILLNEAVEPAIEEDNSTISSSGTDLTSSDDTNRSLDEASSLRLLPRDESDSQRESAHLSESDETESELLSNSASESESDELSEFMNDESDLKSNSELKSKDSNTASDIDYSKYESLDQVIQDLIVEYGFDSNQLGIAYTNLISGESYQLNADKVAHAASTNKVGTSVMYVDFINQGLLDWDTLLPFSEAYVEEGGGEITNNPFQTSYTMEDLLYNCLVFSDNTAWNMLINYYYANFGDFQSDLINLSGIDEVSAELYNLNYASPRMLNEILIKVATESQYDPIVDYMSLAQPGQRFRLYVDEGMATKYGMYDTGYHDTGIFFDLNGTPIYTLVLMSYDLGMIDYFMGDLNLRVNEWTYYNLNS